jgi:hypothetical protein
VFFQTAVVTASACTIVVLADESRVLFCNNEDYSSPNTRIWFVPAEGKRFGGVFVGFDNGWAQGGLNTQGLACDWVAGYSAKWARDPKLKDVPGNPNAEMLGTCSTVENAIQFFQTHWVIAFAHARILVADRSGASAIIGASDGSLKIVRAKNRQRRLGFGEAIAGPMLASNSRAEVENGAAILRAARQTGEFATKYSNIFDLKTGEIFLYQFQFDEDPVRLILADELGRGPHRFDMRELREQTRKPEGSENRVIQAPAPTPTAPTSPARPEARQP